MTTAPSQRALGVKNKAEVTARRCRRQHSCYASELDVFSPLPLISPPIYNLNHLAGSGVVERSRGELAGMPVFDGCTDILAPPNQSV